MDESWEEGEICHQIFALSFNLTHSNHVIKYLRCLLILRILIKENGNRSKCTSMANGSCLSMSDLCFLPTQDCNSGTHRHHHIKWNRIFLALRQRAFIFNGT
ncbi:hypothetical protein BLOT_016320 [Blomia tropicalis]|nr:hypothetical protein BLOT_016320 [Blomia tropicalis]